MTAGIALVGASAIAVSPVTPSLPGLSVEQPAVSLLASSIANIPVNLAITLANIPYYESLALQEYAYALGPGGQTGGVPGWIPPGTPQSDIDPGPDKKYGTADDLYKKGGTGSWWTESTDGNTWGWDNGNWPQLAAIGTAIFPSELALPIAQQLQTFAQAEFIAGERVNCEFECADVLGYLGGWLMFQTPLTALLAGTTFPDTVNAIDPATGLPTIKPVWAGQPGAQLNPLGLAQVFADYFMQDPSDNPVMLPNAGDVIANSLALGVDYQNDYNPLVPGSFLYWGAPTLYSVPALLAGLVQNVTGIPNQFVGIGAWQGNAETGGGGIPPGGASAGPADLLTGVPAGFEYLAQGLLGYLNPNTYLGISLGNTLLRTYGWGSLPGSGIAEALSGLGVGSLLGAGDLGGLLPSAVATTFASPDPGSTTTGSGSKVQLTTPGGTSGPETTPGGTSGTDTTRVLKVDGEDAPAPKQQRGPILNLLTNDGNSAAGSNTAVAGTGSGTGRPTPIKDAVKQAGSQLKGAADDVRGGLKDAADSVKKALGGNRDADKSGASSSGSTP